MNSIVEKPWGSFEILKSGKPKRMRLAFSSDQYIEILIKHFCCTDF